MIVKSKFDKLKERFAKEVPFFTYSKMKKFKTHREYIFGTNEIEYDYTCNTIDSGVAIWKYRGLARLEIIDLGLELKYRNKHYGEAIVKIIHETFPNCEIIIYDHSKGFWNAMKKKYPNLILS